ncbi:MAG: response regulator [Kofleriaceae bacterium]|nr:MAG: response regulator [Kofleriaceae bacterium]MBZ0232712.1 response regulator [Kofleriaceae bacterium]
MDERLTILVIEDDPVYAEFVADTLRASGHTVSVAVTGAAARELARRVRVDAVMLDLGLPDESGYELARALRHQHLPASAIIILLTASLYPQRDLADAVGIDMVLTKPVEAAVVGGIVDLIRSRRRSKLERGD